MLVAGLALSAFFLLMGHPGELRFEMVNSEGNMVETTIRPQLDGSIKIRSKEGSIDQRVAATEFFSRRDLRPKIRPERVSMYLDALMIAAYVLLPMGNVVHGPSRTTQMDSSTETNWTPLGQVKKEVQTTS